MKGALPGHTKRLVITRLPAPLQNHVVDVDWLPNRVLPKELLGLVLDLGASGHPRVCDFCLPGTKRPGIEMGVFRGVGRTRIISRTGQALRDRRIMGTWLSQWTE